MTDEGRRMKKNAQQSHSRNRTSDDPSFDPSSFILHPSKRRFGQNFLIDRNIVNRIIQAVQPRSDETIIEIGPGWGALTANLVKQAGRVVAIEFDRDLVPELRNQFADFTNLQIVEADALSIDFCEVVHPAQSARVVANLPYNIATAILQRLVEQRSCVTDMTLMLQREVVDRMTAEAGSPERGYLSVLVEAYCETKKLFDVPPRAFRPIPKVWSTVVRLLVRPQIAADVKDEKLLWQLVSAGFAQRRKTILNNLRDAPEQIQQLLKKRGGASIVLCEAGLPPLRRAETFSLEEWALLMNALV
jgi:16S rRNA (adenine1518-N6/adenine1519-N6)-dimethyltransferase